MVKSVSPAFGLGIFFMLCLSLPVFGEEAVSHFSVENVVEYAFSSEAGSLLVDGEHGSGFWTASFSLNSGLLYAAIGVGGLFSNLPAFDTDYTGVWFNASLDTAPLGFAFSSGFFHRDTLNAEAFGAPITSGGADGYFLHLESPVRFGSWSATPSILFAQGFWEEGDLYWFFGKPQVPALFATGLSAALWEKHRLSFHYLSLDLNMLSSLGENLFSSHFDGAMAAYRWSFNQKPFRLDAVSGLLSLASGMNGRLSSGNQPYLLFPYIFYDTVFDARIYVLFGVLKTEYQRNIFSLKVTLGAAHILWGEFDTDIHSKQKNLSYLGIPIFDGREESYSRSLNPGGLGAAFLSIEGGLNDIPLGRRPSGQTGSAPRLSLTAKKLFAFPWGYEKILGSGFFDQGEQGGKEKGEKSTLTGEGLNFASILLSGLSFFCSITW
jgi:hypothetical protein